ncbi:DUF262 domain-containing protein [Exiguobacterium sp. s155]|uniref:DUF262 domain-containing protein n=1 Tax=Exiguobacterium sp. s155 TaxID=2751286 RepID=UPI001BE79680|nr:DUF262 domain-containing protein [Exiguobacterium sp. s155]
MDDNFRNEFENFSEENEEDLYLSNIESFSSAVIWGTDWTVETIVSQLEKYNIDLSPKFQRRDAWGVTEKSRLIESLILGIPIPPIILAEKDDERGKYIVIDGKQRLLTLRQFYATERDFKELRLNNLQFLDNLNKKTRTEIKEAYGESKYLDQLDNQTIRAIVIKNWPNEEFLFTVFLRLNTGSKKLSPQELRQALHPGHFLDFLDEATANSDLFHKLLNNKEADSRMRDVELALRYFAFKFNIENNKGNLKRFLDTTASILNTEWDARSSLIEYEFKNLEKAINICFEIFGEKSAFSRFVNSKYNNRFNRPLFEAFTYYLSNENIMSEVELNKNDIKVKFEQASKDDLKFNDSISSTTKDLEKVEYRFSVIRNIIEDSIKSGELPKVVKDGSTLKVE